jgi:Homeodomain-like domain
VRRELDRVKWAVERLDRAEGELEAARQERQEALRAAHDAGMSLAELGRFLGVSRQRVARIIAGD